jgi:hypothetical protein
MDHRKVDTPMEVKDFVKNAEQASKSTIHYYQQRIGSIIYPMIITRPDASRTAQKLVEFMQNPSPTHEQAVNRCIAYLYHMKDYGLLYTCDRTNPQNVRTNLLQELRAVIPTDVGGVGGVPLTEMLISSWTNENNSRRNGIDEVHEEKNP